jgi:phospholipase A1/A2
MNFCFRQVNVSRGLRVILLVGTFWLGTAVAPARELTFTFSGGNEAELRAAEVARFHLHVMNASPQTVSWRFPAELEARLTTSNETVTAKLRLVTPAVPESISIATGTFARGEYQLTFPRSLNGEVSVEIFGLNTARLLLSVAPATESTGPERPLWRRLLKDAEPAEAGRPFEAGRFFKQQFSLHEPIYFIAGSEAPNARFQLSFKYQLFNDTGWMSQEQPWLRNLHFAYTQTSLWDWGAPSAPFFDTSYQPAFIYSQERCFGGGERDKFRFDWQMGLQHESNGKSEPDSRSYNIAFVRPTFVFGRNDSFQLTLQPRIWAYLGGLSDNPDLAEYRGYADLRVVLGWRRGLQLATTARMGTDGENHSVQLDLTYPLMQHLRNFSAYLHAQYFTGYGESLLNYNQRSDAFRVGFALYR